MSKEQEKVDELKEEFEQLKVNYQNLKVATSDLEIAKAKAEGEIATLRTAFEKDRERIVSEQNAVLRMRQADLDKAEKEIRVRQEAIRGLEVKYDNLTRMEASVIEQTKTAEAQVLMANETLAKQEKLHADTVRLSEEIAKQKSKLEAIEEALTQKSALLDERSNAVAKSAEDSAVRYAGLEEREVRCARILQELSEKEVGLSALETKLKAQSDELLGREGLVASAQKNFDDREKALNDRESEIHRQEQLIAQRKLELFAEPKAS